MTSRLPALLAAIGLAPLAGCHHQEKAVGHGSISGQILPGSVSDAMLPYDTVKSQAPAAPIETVETRVPEPQADEPADATPTAAPEAGPDSSTAPATPASPPAHEFY